MDRKPEGEGEAMVRTLQGAERGVDERLKESRIRVFEGSRPVKGGEVRGCGGGVRVCGWVVGCVGAMAVLGAIPIVWDTWWDWWERTVGNSA